MAIEQHIEELRAELSWCGGAAERRQITAELRTAEKQLRHRKIVNRSGAMTNRR